MIANDAELDRLQNSYKAAAETWIAVIRAEEELALVHHTVAQIDLWENAHFVAENARHQAEAAKAAYEQALRSHFFDID
ncbi:MAG: hypothetical protein ABSC06_28520 [Rhodopila sp.]|jgi:hypothetical protein